MALCMKVAVATRGLHLKVVLAMSALANVPPAWSELHFGSTCYQRVNGGWSRESFEPPSASQTHLQCEASVAQPPC